MFDLNWDPELNPASQDVAGSGSSPSMVNDSGQTAIEDLAKELGVKLDSTTKDYLWQYYLNEHLSQNAFNRELQADSSRYQRAVNDLKAAGISPFLAFDSLRSGNASSSAGSVSGGLFTQKENSKRETGANVARGIGTVLAIIAAAVIGALL